MPVEVSKQVRHWRDRSPYPGASHPHLSRNSTEMNKPAEPVQPSIYTHSSENTHTTSYRHNTENLEAMTSCSISETSSEPVARGEPQIIPSMKKSVSWTPESSPEHQKAAKKPIRPTRSCTVMFREQFRERELQREIARVLSARTQTHPDANNRPLSSPQTPETPSDRIVEQKTSTEAEDGAGSPHTTPAKTTPQKAWLQLDDGIRSPRLILVDRDPNSHHAAPFMTAMVERPEDLDCIPPLSLGSPTTRAAGEYLKQPSSRSNSSSPAHADNKGHNYSAEEKDTRSESSFASSPKGDDVGSGESEDEESEDEESEDEESEDEESEDEESEDEEEEYEAHNEESDSEEEESDEEVEEESKLEVLLGFSAVLFLAFGAEFCLAI